MPASITLNIIKGERAGESFTYTEKESLILGRADDCSIIINEGTVSRYHCMVEIMPPSANIRDFASGNGIKLNGETIVAGRFKTGQSLEEARENEIKEYALKDGDVIALSSKCELAVKVFIPEYCAECLAELEKGGEDLYQNEQGENICPSCHVLLEEERAAARKAAEEARENEQLAKLRRDAIREARDRRKKCLVCGAALKDVRAVDDANICPKCKANPIVILEFMLRMAVEGYAEFADIQGFRKISELGHGGQGAVFKVEEEATGEQYALKLMLSNKSADAMARAKFLREASIGKQLDHPHILRHYRYGSSGDAYYILEEICEGGSVEKLVERSGGKLTEGLATDITLQILDALIYAHSKQVEADLADGTTKKYNGIVHRDIKPANFFLLDKSSKPTAKLADFGMAKAFEAAGLTAFTRTGDLGGTPAYMPRQQIINFKYAKPDVDIWAVAASYYFMLTGCIPKHFGQGKDLWSQALKNQAEPIRKRDRNIKKQLADVIDQALVEKPEIGFPSAIEFKKAIEGAL